MNAGFSTVDSLHCPLTKHCRCHDIAGNMTHFNLWIEATYFLKCPFQKKQIKCIILWSIFYEMKAGFSTVDSLHCPLTKHCRCHDITGNMTHFNLWIEATYFLKCSFQKKQIKCIILWSIFRR